MEDCAYTFSKDSSKFSGYLKGLNAADDAYQFVLNQSNDMFGGKENFNMPNDGMLRTSKFSLAVSDDCDVNLVSDEEEEEREESPKISNSKQSKN